MSRKDWVWVAVVAISLAVVMLLLGVDPLNVAASMACGFGGLTYYLDQQSRAPQPRSQPRPQRRGNLRGLTANPNSRLSKGKNTLANAPRSRPQKPKSQWLTPTPQVPDGVPVKPPPPPRPKWVKTSITTNPLARTTKGKNTLANAPRSRPPVQRRHDPDLAKQQRLRAELDRLTRDPAASTRLVDLVQARNRDKSRTWCLEKAILDLERDRR